MRTLLIVWTFSFVIGAQLGAQSAGPLVGTWRLVSWESRDSDGNVSYPMGRDATGQVMFDSTGSVSIQLMQRNRPRFASGDRAIGTPDEIRAAFVGLLAYYGRYTLDASSGTLRIRVEGASFPNMIGTEQVRHVRIDGRRFTGTTPPVLVAGRMVTGVFVWEKIP